MSFLFGGSQQPYIQSLSEGDLEQAVQDKAILIVGGTKGIGAALAVSLAKRGARVTVTGRSEIKDLPSFDKGSVSFVKSDVSLVKNAQDLVRNQLKGQKFDTVVFTVGIITRSTLTRTADGIEEDLAISYLSRFIIAREMIAADMLTGRKRVYVMGYPGEDTTITNIEDINFEHTEYKQFPAHLNTVTLNEALVYELARRYPQIKVFGLNPGLIQTGIRDNLHGGNTSWIGRIVETLIGWTQMSAEQYAENYLVRIIASPELDTKSGTCYSKKAQLLAKSKWTAQETNTTRAWEVSEQLVTKAQKQ